MTRRDNYRLDGLRAGVAHAHVAAPDVSQWSVGMHVHHCALSMIAIGKGLAASTPPMPPERWTLPRFAVFTFGRIPRGRARTKLVPEPSVPAAELVALLDQSEALVAAALGLDRDSWITHPVFGPLRRDDALKFVRIHNRHHLRIVSDIMNTQKGR
jgi:hypothetical protein